MTKRLPTLLLTMALLALTSSASFAAVVLGYVDMQRVLQESEAGKQAMASIEKDYGPRMQPFMEQRQAIERMTQTLKRDEMLMSVSQVDKKKAEIRERIAALQKDSGPLEKELAERQQEAVQAILADATKATEAIAKEKKLSIVLERNQIQPIYIDKSTEFSVDITDAVTTKLNSMTK